MSIAAPLPKNEMARLAALRSLDIHPSEIDPVLDQLARTAARICRTPIALISFVDEDRQWFKSCYGVEGLTETPREFSFCAHTILGETVMQVCDAKEDRRFHDNPAVDGPPNLRFYAGAPIDLGEEIRLGTICVADVVPRILEPQQLEVLEELSNVVKERLLERRTNRDTARGLFESSPVMLHSISPDGTLIAVNNEWLSTLGYTREEVLGRKSTEFLTEESRIYAREVVLPLFFREGVCHDVRYQMVKKSGEVIDVLLSGFLERDAQGRPIRSLAAINNISERHSYEARLAASEERYRHMFEKLRVTLRSIGDAVITTDTQGRVEYLNPIAEKMTGWSLASAQGVSLPEVFRIVDEGTRAPAENPVDQVIAADRVLGGESQSLLLSADGSEYSIEESAAPIRDSGGQLLGVVLVFRDVTDQRRISKEMSHQATHDPLTGILNRAEFDMRLQGAYLDAKLEGVEHSLLYIDLDHFKLVNDACGHAVGDELLRRIAAVIESCIRSGDTFARLGGDEFAVILDRCSTVAAMRVAQSIRIQVEEHRFLHEGRRFRVGASIGMVPISRIWDSPSDLLKAADAACYTAKESGRNRVHAYLEVDDASTMHRGDTNWAERLEKALADDRFALLGQRLFRAADRRQVGVEALLRMREPNGALTAPSTFLPVAERFRLGTSLDCWVVREVCRRMAEDPAAYAELDFVSVNLCSQSVGSPDLLVLIEEIGAGGKLDLSKLCFEVRESSVYSNVDEASLFFHRLKSFGVRSSLCGCGGSGAAFGYLKLLCVDFLKIDGELIRGMADDPVCLHTVKCLTEIARSLRAIPVAERVESETVLDLAISMGIDIAQGFLLHEPEALDVITRFLK
jgi:diguanylate cyclase (GGDEF)-like protein/PAS domain S-box-containing protein